MTGHQALLDAIFSPTPTESEFPVDQAIAEAVAEWGASHPAVKTLVIADEYGNHEVHLSGDGAPYLGRTARLNRYSPTYWLADLDRALRS